jgi:hypothetical protein
MNPRNRVRRPAFQPQQAYLANLCNGGVIHAYHPASD